MMLYMRMDSHHAARHLTKYNNTQSLDNDEQQPSAADKPNNTDSIDSLMLVGFINGSTTQKFCG